MRVFACAGSGSSGDHAAKGSRSRTRDATLAVAHTTVSSAGSAATRSSGHRSVAKVEAFRFEQGDEVGYAVERRGLFRLHVVAEGLVNAHGQGDHAEGVPGVDLVAGQVE